MLYEIAEEEGLSIGRVRLIGNKKTNITISNYTKEKE